MAKLLLLYLEPTRGIFYGGDMPTMQQIDFPQDIIRDLEILNKEKFHELLVSFLETNQIPPLPITFILSPLFTFDKDLSEIPAEEKEKEAQKFLDQVPFQEIIPYRFIQQQKYKVIAVNKEFISAIKTVIEKKGFTLHSILALSVIQEILPELTNELNLDLILTKADNLKQYSMLNMQESQKIISSQKPTGKQDNKRLIVLGGIFIVLLLILIIVAVINLTPQQPSSHHISTVPTPVISSSLSSTTESGSQSAFRNTPNQKVEGISTQRNIIPTFYEITTGGK